MLLVTVNTDVTQETEVILFRKDITDSLNGASVWQSFTLPVTLSVGYPDTDMFWFTLEHYDTGEASSVIDIDNVILYVDSRRCPLVTDVACDDPHQRVLLNGRCETCKDDQGMPLAACAVDHWQNGCAVARTGMYAECTVCPTVQDAGGGSFVTDTIRGQECTFTCDEGFFYSRLGSTTGGPICKQCTPQASLQCHVGWYMAGCEGETDRACVPCEVLDSYDLSVVYTTAAYSTDALPQCTHTCSRGQFQYGVRVDNGVAMCFKCTVGICGAKDNGLSAPRFRDGLQ